MRRRYSQLSGIFVALLLLLNVSAVFAEWVHFGTVAEDNDIYIDHSRHERVENPRIWVMFDSKDPDEDGSKSVVQRYEADCAGNKVRNLEFSYFAGNMGGGRLIRKSQSASPWETPVPRSTLSGILDIMCDRVLNDRFARLERRWHLASAISPFH
jgi:hypothetical protein